MKIDGIIVVEGKTDVAFLSNFVEAEFVTTNGSEISKETISYLKKVSESKPIYVLTDPDYPGEKIRSVLNDNINNLHHCFVDKSKSIKNGKVGVAESTKEEIEKALANAIVIDKTKTGNVSSSDLMRLGLTGNRDSSIKRQKVADALHLGHCNSKTFLKRINYCGINIDDIEKAL